MNKLSKKLKEIVKGSTFGTDPNDPWSAKANIAESGGLTAYLKAKGINPEFVSKDTKISHAKSAEFAKWKQDHQFEEVEYINEDKYLDAYLLARGLNPKTITRDQKIAHAKSTAFLTWKRNHLHEQVDSKDTITLDIPFMIRVLEYAREDAKDDMALHKVVEKLIEIRNKGTLTMDDYDFVTTIKEQYDLTEGRMKDIVTDREEKSRLAAHERGGADAWYGRKYNNPHEIGSIEHKAYHQGYHGGEKDGKDYGTPKGKPVHSFRESALDKWRKAASERQKKHDDAEKEMKARHASGKEDMKGSIDRLEKSLNKEETSHSEHAPATHAAIFHDNEGKLSYIVHFHAENDKHAAAKAKTMNVLQRKDGGEDTLHRVERIVREEVEQIDELNYDTVKSLYDKRRTDYHGAGVGEKKKGKKVSAKNVGASISRLTGFKPTQNKPKSKVKEEVEQIDEMKKSTLDSYKDKALDSLKNAQSNKDASEDGKHMSRAFAKLHAKSSEIADKRAKGLKGYLQRKHGMKPGYDDQRKTTSEGYETEGFKVGDAVRHQDGLHGTVTKDEDKDGLVNWKGPTAGYRVSHSSALTKHTKVPRWRKTNEDVFQDSQAATQTCFDGANAPDNTEPQMPGSNRKREMSKSARIIKSIYNKLGMVKEELYDHEKEDKSVATYGKKPKLQQVEADKQNGETSPKAAAVLSGGKTLTGQSRDTLEIDPEMKRPIRFGTKKQ